MNQNDEERELSRESGEYLTEEDVEQVLEVEQAVEEAFENLELDYSELDKLSEEEKRETLRNIDKEASQATFLALQQAGIPIEEDVDITAMLPGKEKKIAFGQQQKKNERRRIITLMGTLTQGIADEVSRLDSDVSETVLEKRIAEGIDESATKDLGIIAKAGEVATFFWKLLPGNAQRKNEQEIKKNFGAEYKSIILELSRRLNYVKRILKHIGGGGVGTELKVAMSFTTLIPFAFLGEMRSKFDLAHKVLWWLNRTSRIYIEDRHGGIGEREPQDEILRSEGSSFPLAAEIPQTDVASILTMKLVRYAENQKEYFLDDGKAHVLVWKNNAPVRVDVPLGWFANYPIEVVKTRIEALLREAITLDTSSLSDASMKYLRDKAYGKYSDHDAATKTIFDADLSIVLDDINVDDPNEAMNHPAFLTGGARMRETMIFRHSGSQDELSGITGIVNKFSHTHVDGKKARQMMLHDLEHTAELSQRVGPELQSFNAVGLVKVVETSGVREAAEKSQEILDVQEFYGVAKVDAQRSNFWINTIGALRKWYEKENLNDPPSFGTADIFCLAQMLASRTTGVHFLESKMAMLPSKRDGKDTTKEVEVLDVAFNVIPSEYLDIFTELVARVRSSGKAINGETIAQAWRELPYSESQITTLRKHVVEGLKLFVEEKKRAKKSGSTASFMSTLAGGIKQVEKLMQFVSKSGISVGDNITHAVGNPRGGLVSMLADTRGLPERHEDGVNMLWFGSANTDTFTGTSVENWGGVLGISSSSEGFTFLLRKLESQSKVPPEYYEYNKAFKDQIKQSMYEKVAKIKDLELSALPHLLADYEKSQGSARRNFFGSGVNSELIAMDLRRKLEYFSEGLKIRPEQDAQRQAEDVVIAVEFLLHLLASDPAFHESLQS